MEQDNVSMEQDKELLPKQKMLLALIAAKAEFQKVTKKANNSFFNSKYATLEEVLQAVESALSKHKFVIDHTISYRDAKAFMVTSIIHVPTMCCLQTEIELSFKSGDMQSLGSAITYARRYSIVMLLGLAAEDDDGNATRNDSQHQQQAQKPNPFKK